MISIENFNWILYQNLLQPSNLDCRYYLPFGTRDQLNRDDFAPHTPKQQSHVLFTFDQEPIWNDDFGIYDNDRDSWSYKSLRILANSEHSALKKNILAQRKMADWYFFYHGFAALDWYRDAQFIEADCEIKNAFLSLNHVIVRRAYRLGLLIRLMDRDIALKGSISFHATREKICAELEQIGNGLSSRDLAMIQDKMHDLSTLPWQLDDVPINGDLSARFGHQEFKLWQSSLWHLVNETVFYEPKLHLTEKVFKPIIAKRPFVLVAAPGNLEYLRSYGFRTFDQWIDEGYDQMQDPDQRLDAIADQIGKFARMDRKSLQEVHRDMLPILEFNKKHFFGKFREIIVEELVDNLDQCIRIWNNGRLDGRSLPFHPDLRSAKQFLLR